MAGSQVEVEPMGVIEVVRRMEDGARPRLWVNNQYVGPITNPRRVGESFEFTADKVIHKEHQYSTIYVTWG